MEQELNLLLVVGAPLDPVPSQEKLRQLLTDARVVWGPKASRGTDQIIYKRFLGEVPNMEKAFADGNEAQVSAIAANALKVVNGALDPVLEAAAENNQISAGQLDLICNKTKKRIKKTHFGVEYQVDEALVRKRAAELKYTVAEGGATASTNDGSNDVYKRYMEDKLPGWAGYKKETDLIVLGKSDLYDFACPDGCADPYRAPSADLLAKAKQVAGSFRANTPEQAAAASLEALCRKAFGTDDARKEYDACLNRLKLNRVFDELDELASFSDNSLRVEQQRAAVETLAPFVADKTEARSLLVGHCKKKGISLERDAELDSLVQCRCGHMNDKSAATCGRCGLPLMLECPSCHKKYPNTNDRCPGCGAPLGAAIEDAERLCDAADKLAGWLNFEGAKANLAQARSAWPSLPRVAEVDTKVAQLQTAAGDLGAKLTSAIAERRFAEADGLLRRALLVPGVDAAYLKAREAEVSSGVTEADDLVRQAQGTADAEEAAELCEQALARCADHAAARSFLASHAPQSVSNLEARGNAETSTVSLVWQPSRSRGALVYEIYVVEGDGSSGDQLLGTTDQPSYTHEHAPQGCALAYKVVVVRVGVRSQPATSEVIALAPDLTDVRFMPAHEQIEVSWKPLPSSATVQITPLDGGDPITVPSGGHYVIGGLTDGVTYHYEMSASFDIVGLGRRQTHPQTFEATPLDATHYVDGLVSRAHKGAEGVFDLEWEDVGAEVRFFGSVDAKSIPQPGSTSDVASLERDFEVVSVNVAGPGKGTLTWKSDDVLYFFAATVCGSSAIVGAKARVSNGGKVSIDSIEEANGKLLIYVSVKDRAVTGFSVAVSETSFVDDLSDSSCQPRPVSKKNWERDGCLTVPAPDGQRLYVSVFSRKGSVGSFEFSDPAQQIFERRHAHVCYERTDSKKLFGPRESTFTFSAQEGGSFTLPKTKIAYCIGNLSPALSVDSVTLEEFGPVEVDGTYSITVMLPKAKKISIQAFPASGIKSVEDAYITSSGYLVQ